MLCALPQGSSRDLRRQHSARGHLARLSALSFGNFPSQPLKQENKRKAILGFPCFFGEASLQFGFKLEEGRFRFDIRKNFFVMKGMKRWKSLPREALVDPSLKVFKASLDGALRNLI